MTPIPLGVLALSGSLLAGAFDLLETTTLTTSASSVTFSGLGAYSDYKHLQLRSVMRSTRASIADSTVLQFNGDTGTNYANHYIRGSGSSVSSSNQTGRTDIILGNAPAASSGTGVFTGQILDILDFGSSSKNTTIRELSGFEDGSNLKEIRLSSGVYLSTDAITSLTIFYITGPAIEVGSRLSLYGIKGA
jgi:hypothetical protein